MTQMQWNPASLMEFSGSYWGVGALHAAVGLGLFSHLEDGSMPASELAPRIGADLRALNMLLEALCALGLLEKEQEHYRNTAFAKEYLDKKSPTYLGQILMHHHHLMESWVHLDQAVLSGKPLRERSSFSDEDWRENFLLGMFNIANLLAPILVPQIDIGDRTRLLDLGGGPGTYAVHFCHKYPEMQACVYDLPTTRAFAESIISRFGLRDRIDFQDGNFLEQGINGRYDIAWLSHILHGEGPEGCRRILDRAVKALEPGGMILVHEFVLDDEGPGPVFPALFSLNMLVGTESGQAYRGKELVAMLEGAGAKNVRRLPLMIPGPSSVLVGFIE